MTSLKSSISPTDGVQDRPALSYEQKLLLQGERNSYMALSALCEKFLLETVHLPDGEERTQVQHDIRGLLGFCRCKVELLQDKIGDGNV